LKSRLSVYMRKNLRMQRCAIALVTP